MSEGIVTVDAVYEFEALADAAESQCFYRPYPERSEEQALLFFTDGCLIDECQVSPNHRRCSSDPLA